MSVYTIEDVIAECVRSYKIKELTAGAKLEIYTTSWQSLNAWIETKLVKQKGAGITGLGCFAWEIKQKDGETSCRPIFVISEAFVKNFNVKKERTFRLPRTTAVETVNFSNIAIKFSKTLTKDMVFVGIRDIIKKIGDLVSKGLELAVNFTFGTLFVKEKVVKFEFNIGKLAEILPETDNNGFYGYDESKLGYSLYEDQDNPNNASNFMDALEDIDNFQPSAPQSTRETTISHATMLPPLPSGRSVITNPSQPATSRPLSFREPSPRTLKSFDASSNPYISGSSPSISGGSSPAPVELRDILDRIENKAKAKNKQEFRRKACETVLEQAFVRSLNNIETQANFDDKITAAEADGYADWKKQLREKKERNREDTIRLNKDLKEQFQFHEDRKLQSRQEFLTSKMDVFLHDRPNSRLEETQKNLNTALLQQIADKEVSKRSTKTKELEKEREYLKQLAMENELNEAMERATHLEKQRDLLEAWERDGHVRNLRKVQEYGTTAVKEYIDKNLGIDTVDPDFTALQHKGHVGKSLNMSIGYDPRKTRATS